MGWSDMVLPKSACSNSRRSYKNLSFGLMEGLFFFKKTKASVTVHSNSFIKYPIQMVAEIKKFRVITGRQMLPDLDVPLRQCTKTLCLLPIAESGKKE